MAQRCGRCTFIRGFLIIAALILGIIAFMPEMATPFGRFVPSPMSVALAVPLFGIPAFLVKFALWRRQIRD